MIERVVDKVFLMSVAQDAVRMRLRLMINWKFEFHCREFHRIGSIVSSILVMGIWKFSNWSSFWNCYFDF